MKLNVLMIDDEYIVLKGLEAVLSTQSQVPIHIELATDAIDALSKMENYHPDVIIADINMPELDGLTMLEQLSNQDGFCKFIIISGYEKTNYLKRAIRLKVVDYLTKPVDKERLIAALLEVQIEKQKLMDYSLLKIRTGLSSKSYALKDELSIAEAAITFPAPHITLIYIYRCRDDNSLSLRLKTYFSGVYSFSRDNRTIFILNSAHYISNEDIYKLLIQLSTLTTFGVATKKNWSSASSLMDEIKNLYRIAFTDYIRTTIGKKDKRILQLKTIDIIKQFPEILSRLLWQQDIATYIHDIWHKNIEHKKTVIFIDMISAYSLANDLDISPEDIGKLYVQLEDTVNNESDFEVFIYKTLHLPFQPISENRMKFSPKILHAIQFIDKNYKKDISLEEIAREIHHNPSYLSHVFKKEVGVTFLQYLNNLRIKKACNLLSRSNMTTEEISYEVGYNSSSYFHKIFRTYMNMTPKQWRSKYPS